MADMDKDDIPMLTTFTTSSQQSDENTDFNPQRRTSRSASMSIPMYHFDPYDDDENPRNVSHTGPLRSDRRIPLTQMSGPLYTPRKDDNAVWPVGALKSRTSSKVQAVQYPSFSRADRIAWPDEELAGKNENLMKSGQLGKCNDPYCTTCPTYYDYQGAQQKISRFEAKFHNFLREDTKNWMKRLGSSIGSRLPGIMNPHARKVQQWNKFFVIACLVAIFVDPLFFFLLRVHEENKCIVLNWPMATTIAAVRSVTDFIYFLHMLLQFRLAYVAPESRVVGAGELVDRPGKIALNYFYGKFWFDFFNVLPLPQIMILFVLPKYVGSSSANYAKNLLRATVLLQYIPRFVRFLPLVAGSSPSGFIFETAWANFVINLLIFVLAGHVVGSSWYLFGLQRVNQCFRDACVDSPVGKICNKFIDCGNGDIDFAKTNLTAWNMWKGNETVRSCLEKEGSFNYGVYKEAVKITTSRSIVTRYIYALFWGFQQISTLGGNLTPSGFVWEVLFTMAIIGLGLFLFALLIGNMQNYLQALGKRRLEMQLRHRDVERWMSHRRLPDDVRRRVRKSERFHWAATRGVNEELLLENLPEDLQREIRRHLFEFITKFAIFGLMTEPILDAICERLRQKLYIEGSKIIYNGSVIDKILFIVRGNLTSVDKDGNEAPLSEGDICCEELLTWSLDHSSLPRGSPNEQKNRITGHRLLSNRTVTCVNNVEAFSLSASDLEEVTTLFPHFFRGPRVQGAIRYVSPYWRGLAASRIIVAWKAYRSRVRVRRGSINFSSKT